jgi:hypothetical protein
MLVQGAEGPAEVIFWLRHWGYSMIGLQRWIGATLAACPIASVLALTGATSYWASVVANPPGHMSNRGASSNGYKIGRSRRAGPSDQVTTKPNQALSTGTGISNRGLYIGDIAILFLLHDPY